MKRKINFLPILAVIVLFFALNSYVLSGFGTLNQSSLLAPFFWVFIIGLTVALFFAITQMRTNGMSKFFQIITHAFLIVFTAEVVFAFFLLVGDLFRLVLSISSNFQPDGFQVLGRSIYWVDFAFVMFCLTVILFIFGITRGKYAYRVIKHSFYFDDLPDSFDGFTITQISDIHAGSFTKPKQVQKGIDLINAQKSDLFVFTGDLVNNSASEIVPYIGHFSQIKAPFGQFSVLGNHDYGDYIKWPSEADKIKNLQQLKSYHAELGFKLLLDEHVELTKSGEKIILAGIENWGLGFGERGDLAKALAGTNMNDFKVLLSHDPSHWDAQVKNNPSKIQLALAGHTHGMQFGIEAFGIKWSPVKYRYKHWGGIKFENGRYLNVNRGFGFLGFSGRIGIWPEITVIELKKSSNR
ncbi:metallophosphoesterase [Pedobacter sp. MC2016-05]|uniref:metallophosphoesterase n=1 Tax=Pedobacter sp. MC2016-05 TaxID=2994474 RepID=UPI0022453E11|nr:metallophosphoesterase [Pedobacter sp. MC2016-05]MCX2473408.1 metallophosphoesterase [Pedobacter sp. MC2016-05]